MSTQKVYPTYSFQYIQNKLVELSRQKLNSADVVEQVQADWTEADIFSPAYIKNKPSLTGYVPYIGATSDVDLGVYGLIADKITLNTTPTQALTGAGQMRWNDIDGTLDIRLKGNNVTLQVGQEMVLRAVNKTGATLNEADFRVVRVRLVSEGGASGQRLAVVLAQGNNDLNSATTIGVVTETILNNQEGFITTNGEIHEIDTTGAKSYSGTETWVDGDILFLDPLHAGYLTNVKPTAPNHAVTIGYVEYAHANHGKIYVKIDNGYELEELHNVLITTPANNDVLVYESATSLWKNKTLATILGYTPVPTTRTLTINGTTYDLSADRSWTISSGGMTNPMTTLGDIIYGGASGTPTRLGIGATATFLQVIGGIPAWFDLFATANTFTAQQTIQSNITRVLRLNGINSGGYASGTTISASAANQPVTVTNAQGIIFTHNESVNTNTYFPLFTFANRSLGGYVATVPEWQLRMFSPGSGSTGCRIMEITIPSSTAFTASQIAERWDIFQTSSSYAFKQHYLRTSIDTAGALNPASALLHLGAAATGYASLNIKTGTAPTSPQDGDMWYTGGVLYFRAGALTKMISLI